MRGARSHETTKEPKDCWPEKQLKEEWRVGFPGDGASFEIITDVSGKVAALGFGGEKLAVGTGWHAGIEINAIASKVDL